MSIIRKRLRIGGMTCVNCQNRIERELKGADGIRKVTVSYNTGFADITYDSDFLTLEDITDMIERLDYQVLPETEKTGGNIGKAAELLAVIAAFYVLLQRFGILNLLVPGQLADTKMGYGMLFVIGLITSVHCIAMCGGINLSQCIPRGADGEENSGRLVVFLPSFLYNTGRVISYTMIGFLLGAVGMVIGGGSGTGISALFQGILKIIAGIFMVIMGVNMLGIFPLLRRFNLRMPKALAAKIGREKAVSRQPLIVGFLNGLMPCGPLQSMQIVALASGNPFVGALSMLLFSLGTVPLMLGLGSLVSALGRKFSRTVMNIGAVLVVVLGLAMLSQGCSLSGLFLPDHFLAPEIGETDTAAAEAEIAGGVQVVNSTLTPGRYPNITVQAGIPVKWVIDAPAGSINGCNYKMLLREYGLEHEFTEGENIIEFTPTQAGAVQYACWMGMIRGNIFVTDGNETGEAPSAGIPAEVPVPAGYRIPSGQLAVAQLSQDENGQEMQEVSIDLTENGFYPAVVVVESDVQVVWHINNTLAEAGDGTQLLAPAYSTKLGLGQGENILYLYPQDSFEVSTGDNRFYAYVKVVEDISQVDGEAVRQEVDGFETLIYPNAVFESSGMGCCGGY